MALRLVGSGPRRRRATRSLHSVVVTQAGLYATVTLSVQDRDNHGVFFLYLDVYWGTWLVTHGGLSFPFHKFRQIWILFEGACTSCLGDMKFKDSNLRDLTNVAVPPSSAIAHMQYERRYDICIHIMITFANCSDVHLFALLEHLL